MSKVHLQYGVFPTSPDDKKAQRKKAIRLKLVLDYAERTESGQIEKLGENVVVLAVAWPQNEEPCVKEKTIFAVPDSSWLDLITVAMAGIWSSLKHLKPPPMLPDGSNAEQKDSSWPKLKSRCPHCGELVRNPEYGYVSIPVLYIGDDPVGYQCECGAVLSALDLIEIEKAMK